jgi:predicted nucleic acid-binding protein
MNFILPLPFQGLEYFINAPAEDLFIAATSLSGGEQIVVQDNLLAIIQ